MCYKLAVQEVVTSIYCSQAPVRVIGSVGTETKFSPWNKKQTKGAKQLAFERLWKRFTSQEPLNIPYISILKSGWTFWDYESDKRRSHTISRLSDFSLVTSKTNFWVYHNIIALSLFLDHTNQHVEPPGTTVPHESTYLTPWPLEEHKTTTNSSHFSVIWADWVIVIQSLVNWPSPNCFGRPLFLLPRTLEFPVFLALLLWWTNATTLFELMLMSFWVNVKNGIIQKPNHR